MRRIEQHNVGTTRSLPPRIMCKVHARFCMPFTSCTRACTLKNVRSSHVGRT